MGVPDKATELTDQGFAHIEMGQRARAVSELTQALVLDPPLADANLNLSIALRCQGKYQKAAKKLIAGAHVEVETKFDMIENIGDPPAE